MSDGRDDRDESARDEDDDLHESAREGGDGRRGTEDPPRDDGPDRRAGDGSDSRPRDRPDARASDAPDRRAPGVSPDRRVENRDAAADNQNAAGQRPGTAADPERGTATPGAGRERINPAEYTTDRRSLSPRVQLQWGIRTVITAVVVGLIITFVLRGFDQDPRLGGALTAALVILGLVWDVLQYRVWVYQIQDDAIYLERGVFTHVRTLVPYVRIQHVDTSRGPFERTLGLSTLIVYTAGSRGADVSIPGLTPEEARDLQERVKELAIEAEGDDAL